MKRRLLCLPLILAILLCSTALADGGTRFYRHTQYGVPESYENMVYGYSLKIYSGFSPAPDETMEVILQHYDAQAEAGGDTIYDSRIWISPDDLYQFELQVKEPTYDSFETELLQAPYYLDLMGVHYSEYSNVRLLHEGRLHSTPVGTMLETAVAYDEEYDDGWVEHHLFIYYDIYLNGVEYCFSLTSDHGTYEIALDVLDEIVQSFRLTSGVRA